MSEETTPTTDTSSSFGSSLGDILDNSMASRWGSTQGETQKGEAVPDKATAPKVAPRLNPTPESEETEVESEDESLDAEEETAEETEDTSTEEQDDSSESEETDESTEEPAKDEKPEADEEPTEERSSEEEDENPYEKRPGVLKRLEKQKKRLEREWSEKLSERDKKVQELEAKLQELESAKPEKEEKLSDPDREELIMLRRKVAAESDPEIKAKFDDRITDNRATIEETLAEAFPHPDDQADLKKLGSLDEFARSNPKAFKAILDRLEENDPVKADVIRQKIAENISLQKGKVRAVEAATKDAREWWDKQQEKREAGTKEKQKEVEDFKGRLRNYGEATKQLDPFKLVETKGLDGEKLKEAKQTNELRKKMQAVVDMSYEAILDADTEQIAQVVAGAALYKQAEATINSLKAEMEKLKGELEQRKKAGTVSREARATARTTQKQSTKKTESSGDWVADFEAGAKKVGW